MIKAQCIVHYVRKVDSRESRREKLLPDKWMFYLFLFLGQLYDALVIEGL